MRTAGGQAQIGALRRAQAPADARALGPARQARQIGGLQAKAGGDGRHVQQVVQLTQAAALLRQAQQPVECQQQRVLAALGQVGNVKRDVAGVAARLLAKHRADGRRKAADVGHHHHDVARVQRRAAGRLGQQRQQLVVQDFHLALRAVGDVEDDGSVGRIGRRVGVLGQRQQVADAGLHLLQQVGARAVVKQINLVGRKALPGQQTLVKGVELAHKIAALPAPGGQQRVGVGMHRVQRQRRQIKAGAQRLAALCLAQQLTAVDGVGPVVAAGIGHGQQDLAMR